MTSSQTCRKCGEPLRETARFCDGCGVSVAPNPETNFASTPKGGFRYEIGQGLKRYWLWATSGGWERKVVGIGGPLLAVLVLFGSISTESKDVNNKQTSSPEVKSQSAPAGETVVPPAKAGAPAPPETAPAVQPTSTPVPASTAAPVRNEPPPPPVNRRNCEAIKGTPYASEDERSWFLTNCFATPTPVRDSALTYLTTVGDIADFYSDELDTFTALMKQGSNRPTLFVDEAWKSRVNQSMNRMKLYGAQARALKPPSCYKAANDIFVSAINSFDDSFILIARGIDLIQASYLEQATVKMQTGTAQIGRFTPALLAARC